MTPKQKEFYARISHVLTEREQKVISLRFSDPPMTLAQVAAVIGVKTRERVRQIQNIALSKLRMASRDLLE